MVVGAVGTGRSLGNCVYLCSFDLPVPYFMVAWNGLHFFLLISGQSSTFVLISHNATALQEFIT